MPVVAYIIASHTNPQQVRRLVARIRAERPKAPIVLHHDESVSHFPAELLDKDDMLRFLLPHVNGAWGTFGLVKIALAAISTLLAWQTPFDFITFLSGQDYPITTLDEFERNIALDGAIVAGDRRPQSMDRYRFAYHRLPRTWETRGMHRLFFVLQATRHIQPFVRFTTGRVGCQVGYRRSMSGRIGGLQVRKGYTWWTLSRRAAEFVQTFAQRESAFVEYFAKRVLLPDEAFFQTILGSSSMSFSPDDGRYTRWVSPDAMNPDVLKTADYHKIVTSGKFLARKFDMSIDSSILDLLDSHSHIENLTYDSQRFLK